MKKSILIVMSMLFAYSAKAGNVPPVAVLTSTPNQTWFYNLEDVVFSSTSSYDTDGYVNYTRFYINGVLQYSSSYTSSYSACFALYGSPAGDCYQLANGATTVQVKVEVRDNSGAWSSQTKTYTIQAHKGRKYFVKDHLGTVRATVNRDGNVLGYDDYYPFGLVMSGRSNNTGNPNDAYKFTGHERDDEAGLTVDYMGARFYDPIVPRFMSIDPLTDQFPGWTPYHYVHNNPLNLIDPTGMAAERNDPPSKYVNQMKYSLRMAFGPLVETAQNFITPAEVTTEASVELGAGSSDIGTGYEVSYTSTSTRDENGNEVRSEGKFDINQTLNLGPVSTSKSLLTREESSTVTLGGKKGGATINTSNGQLESVTADFKLGPVTTSIGTTSSHTYSISQSVDKDFSLGNIYAKVKAKVTGLFRDPVEATKEDLRQFE